MASKIPVFVIAGPTAVGKTDLAIAIAEWVNGEIISADSVQVYRKLDIGSAKASHTMQEKIPHHGLDLVDPADAFTVRDYQKYAQAAIMDIYQRGKLPIITGGTGLWIRAVLKNFPFPEEREDFLGYRDYLIALGERYGWRALREMLAMVDGVSAQKIHPNDQRRTIRALEVYWKTGHQLPRDAAPSPYAYQFWILTRPLMILHDRIERRINAMLSEGLEKEVRELLLARTPVHSQSLRSIGYREMVEWLRGLVTEVERNQLMIIHTRQYAKRQLTWFRAEKDAHWLDLEAVGHQRALEVLQTSAHHLIGRTLDCQ